MRLHNRRIARFGVSMICVFGMTLTAMPVYAEDITNLENKTSNLQDQLDGINKELVAISDKIADTEEKIESSNNEVFRLQASLQISRNNEQRQYDNMKDRIRFMYENGSATMLSMLFQADDMADFLNKADFIQNVTEYDREMLENLVEVRKGIETQEEDLQKQQDELAKLQKDLASEQEELQAKADATSTDLNAFKAKLQAAREEQTKKSEEAKKVASASTSQKTNTSNGSNSSSGNNASNPTPGAPSNSGGDSSSGDYSGEYIIPSGGLTPSKGRIWFNGHTETYYSQKVLPGGGLDIPGRHIASDGTIRDANNYIVVASDDYPKGTIIETSLGTGMVYDTGSGSGNIDLYTDW